MKYLALVALLSLTACMSGGTPVNPSTAAAFAAGTTTIDQVIGDLGQPTSDTTNGDGTRTLVYAHFHTAVAPQSFIPIVGPLVAHADTSSTMYVFMFDTAGVLTRTTSSATH
jgi:hypothetical protein